MVSKRVQLPVTEDACDPRRLPELVRSGDASSLDTIPRCYGARLMADERTQAAKLLAGVNKALK